MNEIVNKEFLYRGNNVVITRVDALPDDKLKIKFNTSQNVETCIIIPKKDFNDEFLPVDNSSSIVTTQTSNAMTKMNDVFSSMASGLMDDFNKISDNPNYVPQAKQRTETVKTIIDVFKTQLDAIKVTNKVL